MAKLILRTRGKDEPPVWKEGRRVLETEREWLLEGPAPALKAVVDAFPEHAESISGNVALLSFRGAVGRYTLPGFGEIELVSGKWTEADFDDLLRDLTDVAAALPFARRIGSGLPYERVLLPEQQVPFHAFVYLRYALSPSAPAHDRLDLALRRILASPHRRLIAISGLVPIERAHNVGPRGLLRALASPWELRALAKHDQGAVAAALKGNLPERIEEDQRHQSVDTPENRFVRAVLDLATTIIDRTRAQVRRWRQAGPRDRVLEDCDRMERTLAPLRAHSVWRDVGPMVVFPSSSMVLQRRHGYREVLQHFVRLRMVSRIPLDQRSTKNLLALKDVATLYELWAFFAVVRAVERVLGQASHADEPAESDGQLAAGWGLRVAWPDGTEVLYNARFARGSNRASTSLPLRPDVTLRVPAGPNRGLHLLDAKFRLESPAGLDSGDDDPSTFKRADLVKMHAYRDAIPEAKSVWILYPGTEYRFFPAKEDAPTGAYRGVGATPARPGEHGLDGVVADLVGPARYRRSGSLV